MYSRSTRRVVRSIFWKDTSISPESKRSLLRRMRLAEIFRGEIGKIAKIAKDAGLVEHPLGGLMLRFMQKTKLHVTVTSTVKNAPAAAVRCVQSVRVQTHKGWRHVFVAVDKETLEAARAAANGEERCEVLAPIEDDASVLQNLLPVWRSLPDDEIVVWVDGDDALTSHALERVLIAHEAGAWVTYGQFLSSTGQMGFAAPVGSRPREEPWRATHLKTFHAGLVKQMRDDDFREVDGRYAGMVPDQRVMLGVLELAGRRGPSLFRRSSTSIMRLTRFSRTLRPMSRREKRSKHRAFEQ